MDWLFVLNLQLAAFTARSNLSCGLTGGRCKRQDGNITSPFDGDRHLSLVLRTVPGNPTGNDLPPFRYEITKDPWIPIVDLQFFIRAETTNLSPQERFFLSIRSWFLSRFPHPLLLSHFRSAVGFTSSTVWRSVAITSVRV